MNWREWPQGAESIDAPGDRELCPVCSSTLRPIEVYYTSKVDNTAYYTAICPHCRTRYERYAPADTVIINPEAENITKLEERVIILEETLSRLIAFIRQSQVQPAALQEQKSRTENDTPEEFTRKYRYLL